MFLTRSRRERPVQLALLLLASLGFVLFFSFRLIAAPANLQGLVLDSEGASIAKAHVVIRADASGRRATKNGVDDIVVDTDASGRFAAQLQPGFYDICVMADAFSPACQKVLVDSISTLRPKIRMRADPDIAKHLGDVF